jgi:hypothetical protein
MARTNKKRSVKIEHGSNAHADLIGIRKATEDDTIKYKGWCLVDNTAFGPQASEKYIFEVLRQKVSVLEAKAPLIPQSEDPNEPNYAPPMFNPA